MKINDFVTGIKETLEIDDEEVTLDTPLNISSLGVLALIVFIHEKFSKKFKEYDLRRINTMSDIVTLVGEDNFE